MKCEIAVFMPILTKYERGLIMGIAEKIAEKSIEEKPPVTEEQIDMAEDEPLKDAHGTLFDPAIHEVDESGKPIITARGNRFKRKRGRKKVDGLTDSTPEAEVSSENDKGPLAFMLTKGFFMGNVGIFGKEFAPMIIPGPNDTEILNEEKWLSDTLTALLEKYDISMTPEYALVFFALTYYGTRLVNEEVRKRVFEKIGLKKKEKEPLKPELKKEKK